MWSLWLTWKDLLDEIQIRQIEKYHFNVHYPLKSMSCSQTVIKGYAKF